MLIVPPPPTHTPPALVEFVPPDFTDLVGASFPIIAAQSPETAEVKGGITGKFGASAVAEVEYYVNGDTRNVYTATMCHGYFFPDQGEPFQYIMHYNNRSPCPDGTWGARINLMTPAVATRITKAGIVYHNVPVGYIREQDITVFPR